MTKIKPETKVMLLVNFIVIVIVAGGFIGLKQKEGLMSVSGAMVKVTGESIADVTGAVTVYSKDGISYVSHGGKLYQATYREETWTSGWSEIEPALLGANSADAYISSIASDNRWTQQTAANIPANPLPAVVVADDAGGGAVTPAPGGVVTPAPGGAVAPVADAGVNFQVGDMIGTIKSDDSPMEFGYRYDGSGNWQAFSRPASDPSASWTSTGFSKTTDDLFSEMALFTAMYTRGEAGLGEGGRFTFYEKGGETTNYEVSRSGLAQLGGPDGRVPGQRVATAGPEMTLDTGGADAAGININEFYEQYGVSQDQVSSTAESIRVDTDGDGVTDVTIAFDPKTGTVQMNQAAQAALAQARQKAEAKAKAEEAKAKAEALWADRTDRMEAAAWAWNAIMNPGAGAQEIGRIIAEDIFGMDATGLAREDLPLPDWMLFGLEGFETGLCSRWDDPADVFIQDYPGHYQGGAFPSVTDMHYITAERVVFGGTGFDVKWVGECKLDGNIGAKWFPKDENEPLGYLYRISWYVSSPVTQAEADEMDSGDCTDMGLDKDCNLEYSIKVFGTSCDMNDLDSDGWGTKDSWDMEIAVDVFKVSPGGISTYTLSIYDIYKYKRVCLDFGEYKYRDEDNHEQIQWPPGCVVDSDGRGKVEETTLKYSDFGWQPAGTTYTGSGSSGTTISGGSGDTPPSDSGGRWCPPLC